jgi:hypothetical protein
VAGLASGDHLAHVGAGDHVAVHVRLHHVFERALDGALVDHLGDLVAAEHLVVLADPRRRLVVALDQVERPADELPLEVDHEATLRNLVTRVGVEPRLKPRVRERPVHRPQRAQRLDIHVVSLHKPYLLHRVAERRHRDDIARPVMVGAAVAARQRAQQRPGQPPLALAAGDVGELDALARVVDEANDRH